MIACGYHPEAPGIGICMKCRTVICAACRTRINEVNYCPACLKRLGRPGADRSPGVGSLAAAGGLFVLAWLVLFGLFWLIQGALAP